MLFLCIKGKSVKLKKNAKTERENAKKLIRQGSKDSVVLVAYKNLGKAANSANPSQLTHGETDHDREAQGEAGLKQQREEREQGERDALLGVTGGDSNTDLRTRISKYFPEPGATTAAGQANAVLNFDSLLEDDVLVASGVASQKDMRLKSRCLHSQALSCLSWSDDSHSPGPSVRTWVCRSPMRSSASWTNVARCKALKAHDCWAQQHIVVIYIKTRIAEVINTLLYQPCSLK